MSPVDAVAVNTNIILWLILTLAVTAGYVVMLILARPKMSKPHRWEENQQVILQIHEQPQDAAASKREKLQEKERKEIEKRLEKMEKTLDQLIEKLNKTTVKEEQKPLEKTEKKQEEVPVIYVAKSLEGEEIIKAAEELKAEISKMASLMKKRKPPAYAGASPVTQ